MVLRGLNHGVIAAVLVACLAPPASARVDFTIERGDRAVPAPFTTGAVRSLAAEAGMTDFLDAFRKWLDQPDVERFEWWARQFVADWSGDGLTDDLTIHQVFTVDGAAIRTAATLRVAEGDTGDLLWTRRWKRESDTIFFPMEAKVGPRGMPGIILGEVTGFGFDTTGITYRYTAFTARGKKLWSRAFSSTVAGSWPITYVATDYVVTAEPFDGLPGKATDLLMASGTVIVPPAWELSAGAISAFVVDGRNGDVVTHPIPEIGAGFVPFAGAMGDFDRDRLDDYVFVNERPNVGPGEDGGTTPVTVGTGVVAARRGTDGIPLWTGGGVDVANQNVQLDDLGDVVGTKEGDVFVETMAQLLDPDNEDQTLTYLIEGAAGHLVWKRRGQWPYSPGDLDGDGSRDVLTQHYYSDEGFVATKVRAFTDMGRPLWKREYRTEHPLQTCCSWLIHWGGGWGVGDYDGDRASDGHLWHWAGGIGATDVDDEIEQFVIDADSGQILVQGGEELQPLGAPPVDGGLSDYARVHLVAGGARIEVYDGTTSALLTSSDLEFDVPLPPEKSYVYAESARLDGDRCADVAVSVYAPAGFYEVMLDGSDGSLSWWRSVGLRDGTARVTSSTDANDAC